MFEGLSVADLGPVGLITLAIVLILFGRLIPRSTYRDLMTDRDYWREAYHLAEKARAEQANQVTELLEHARFTADFIRAMPHPTDTEHDEARP